jgi:hypothetical protein
VAAIVDAEIGSESMNSYVSIEDSDSFFETYPYATTWEDADEDSKARALITATRELDARFEWDGDPVDLDQPLQWPRTGVQRVGFETLYEADEIPEPIINATCEFARQLLESNRLADSDVETQGITSLTAGPVSLTFGSVTAKVIPDAVAAYAGLLGTLRARGGSGAITMARG